MSNEVLSLCDVLEQELAVQRPSAIHEMNRAYASAKEADAAAADAVREKQGFLKRTWLHRAQAREELKQAQKSSDQARQLRLANLMAELGRQERSALCISGGGIRSATFALGALQGFSHHRLLSQFDFVSTVSGGGYTGSWLSAWLTHEVRNGRDIDSIEQDLSSPTPNTTLEPERETVEHLREYSRYLSPQVGLLAADSWTLAATIVRNMLLNWLILVPLLAAALLVPRFAWSVVNFGAAVPSSVLWFLLGVGFFGGAMGVHSIAMNLPSVGDERRNQAAFIKSCLLPLIISGICLTTYWAWACALKVQPKNFMVFCLFGAAMHGAGWLVASGTLSVIHTQHVSASSFVKWFLAASAELGRSIVRTWSITYAVTTGAVGGSLVYLGLRWFPDPVLNSKWYSCFAFPALFCIFAIVQFLFTGFASKNTTDEDREWWARCSAWMLIAAIAWAAASSAVILGPPLIGKLWAGVISAASLGIGGWASLIGFSSKTSSGHEGSSSAASATEVSAWARIFAPKVAPILFLLGLTIGIAYLGDRFIRFVDLYANDVAVTGGVLLCSFAVANIMALFINANAFSLHAMYRNRLIRAYLGASNPDRDPNLFTGFDPKDNMPMAQVHAGKPMHVVNMALNLVNGRRLAWQERKAETFTVTRLHAGSARVGYQSVQSYGGVNGLTLGTAMAISGAAASPNMGYHSSPLLTFLMTFFNARLGWWLANPGEPGRGLWKNPGPRSTIRAFIDEALGFTDDTNAYIYLSDGGHFENLGLYEMVLRRCRTIIVLDAGADPNFAFEDLGNAIRKIRVDLGIQISFVPPFELYARSDSRNHRCGVAKIQYSCIDHGAVDGDLVYIKPALNGGESMDVRQYARAHDLFPQQSTANQFFDESQFESYRRLGLEIVDDICGAVRRPVSLNQFMQAAVAQSGADIRAAAAGC